MLAVAMTNLAPLDTACGDDLAEARWCALQGSARLRQPSSTRGANANQLRGAGARPALNRCLGPALSRRHRPHYPSRGGRAVARVLSDADASVHGARAPGSPGANRVSAPDCGPRPRSSLGRATNRSRSSMTSQDRLQDLRPVQGLRRRRVQRPHPAPASPSQAVPGADRGDNRSPEARIPWVGGAQDPRDTAAAIHRAAPAGDHHRAGGAGPPPPGNASAAAPAAHRTVLSRPSEPNALWCADYKGEFLLGNRRCCYPLTIIDFASRYLLTCEALLTTQEAFAFTSSSGRSRNLAGHGSSAPTTACPSHQPTQSTDSASCRSGGCAWGFTSSASNRGIRNRTAATSACI
jgi:hypothetical protein